MTSTPFISDPRATLFEPIVTLPDEWLACRTCGHATPSDEHHGRETVLSLGRETLPNEPPSQGRREFETTMTRCAGCDEIRQTAEQLVVKYPTGCGRFASPKLAALVTEQALIVAIVAGAPLRITEPRHLRLALDHLAPIGVSLTWRGRFIPIARREAKPDTATAAPFEHLEDDQRQRSRNALGDYLRARTERPQPTPPPFGMACYLCGIGEIVTLPSQAADAWKAVTLQPGPLGGQSVEPVRAAVCRNCADEQLSLGSWGPTLLDRLVLKSAGLWGKRGVENYLLGVTAWGTLAGNPAPNPTPWAHHDLA